MSARALLSIMGVRNTSRRIYLACP